MTIAALIAIPLAIAAGIAYRRLREIREALQTIAGHR